MHYLSEAYERARAAVLPLRCEEAEALEFLTPLSTEYPGIEKWYRNKVVPGLRVETRKLIQIRRDDRIVAVGIAKKEANELKICTVRVSPTWVGRGFGIKVFDSLLHWLDEDRPHLTISAKRLPLFERLFEHYRFEFTSAHVGLYVPRATELGYNETIDRNLS